MVVRDVVEELLGVESATQKEGEVSVRRLDDVGDLVDGIAAVERVRVDEAILDALVDGDASLERLGDAGEECGVDDGSATGGDGGTVDGGGSGSVAGRVGPTRVGAQIGTFRTAGEGEGAILDVSRLGLGGKDANGFRRAPAVEGCGVGGRGGRGMGVVRVRVGDGRDGHEGGVESEKRSGIVRAATPIKGELLALA